MAHLSYSEDDDTRGNPYRNAHGLIPAEDHSPAIYDPYARREWTEDEFLLRDLWRIVSRYRWLIASVFVVSVATAFILTLIVRPVYRTSIVVEIAPNERLVEFDNVKQPRIDERTYLEAQQNILTSRNIARAVIEDLNLEADPEINGEVSQRGPGSLYSAAKALVVEALSTLSEGAAVAAYLTEWSEGDGHSNPLPGEVANRPGSEDGLVRRYLDRLSVDRVGQSNLLQMNMESFEPDKATRLADAHVEAYIRSSRQRRFNSTSGAKEFLQQQIIQAEANLEESEQGLNRLARRHNIVDVDDLSNVIETRLEDLNRTLTETRKERIAVEAEYEQARKGNVHALPVVLDDALLSRLREEYLTLKSEYVKLSAMYKDGYPRMRQLQAKIQDVKTTLEQEIRNTVEGLNTRLEQLSAEEQQLAEQIESQRSKLLDLNEHSVSINIMKRDWDANKQLYSGLLEKLKDVSVVNGMELNTISVVDRIPATKSYPNVRKRIAFGGVLGLFGGFGIAVLLTFMDNTFRTRKELMRVLDFPFLGLVPKIPVREQSRVVPLSILAEHDPQSIMSDAMRAIRTTLLFSRPSSPSKMFLVTSTTSGEGKSVIATNLALSLARNDKRVLLVETDFRRPALAACLDVPNVPGLSEYLEGKTEDAVKETEFANVFCVPGGAFVEHATDLLASEKMGQYLDGLSYEFDFVILDGLPVIGLADSLILGADKVDGVIFVVKAGSTGREAVEESAERLRAINAPVAGSILNCVDMSQQGYSYYADVYARYGTGTGVKSMEHKERRR